LDEKNVIFIKAKKKFTSLDEKKCHFIKAKKNSHLWMKKNAILQKQKKIHTPKLSIFFIQRRD
jgi:hypothetical protein